MDFIKWIGSQFNLVDIFALTPAEIKQRLTARPKLDEVFTIVFSLSLLAALVFIQRAGNFITYYDLLNFINAGLGNFSHYYYAYWAVPFFSLFAKIPYMDVFILMGIINIFSAWFAIRVFGGKPIPLMVSIHLIYILSQGQIVGILAGGFALFVLGLVFQRWNVAGLGAIIALTKFQLGLIPICALLWLWDTDWKNKLKVFFLPLIIFSASLFLYPLWPYQLAQTIIKNPPYPEGSVSLWQWIGPFTLLFWIAPIFFKSPKHERFYLMLTANALALPYFQQTDLLLMFSLFTGCGAALANIFFIIGGYGIFSAVSSWAVIRWMMLIPLGVYSITLYRAVKKRFFA